MKSIKQLISSYLFLPVSIIVFLFLMVIIGIGKMITQETMSNNALLASINNEQTPLLETILETASSSSRHDPLKKQAYIPATPTKISGKLKAGDSLDLSFRKNNISETVKNEFFDSLSSAFSKSKYLREQLDSLYFSELNQSILGNKKRVTSTKHSTTLWLFCFFNSYIFA